MRKYGNGIYSDDKTWPFISGLMKDMHCNICVHKFFIDNNLVSIHFGFKDNNKIYYYVPIYADEWKKSGVGKILELYAIESARSKNLKIFDFMRGHESYKFDLCDRISINYTFSAFKMNKKNKVKVFLYNHLSKRGM